jgi:hypothetical protein
MGSVIDRAIVETLAETGAPSASIAVVRDGAIAYLHADGSAELDPQRPATSEMRYGIGSISFARVREAFEAGSGGKAGILREPSQSCDKGSCGIA